MASKSLMSAQLTINMDLSCSEIVKDEDENDSRPGRKWPDYLRKNGKINRAKLGRLVGRSGSHHFKVRQIMPKSQLQPT